MSEITTSNHIDYIDFKPLEIYKPFCCLPCLPCFGSYQIQETVTNVRKRMNDWIYHQGREIKIINVETFDFEGVDFKALGSHFRLWYTHNRN